MPFNAIRTSTNSSFNEIAHMLITIRNIENTITAPNPYPLEYQILKGFFYVHIYANIEYTINSLITTTIGLAKSKNVPHNHLEIKFNTIATVSNLQSIRDCNPKAFLDKSSDLFIKIESTNIANYDDTFISKYLQNIWGKTFNQLTKTFGMNTFIISPREIFLFDEIVDNRNKLAHGRDSAAAIGASPKYTDLKNKFDEVYDVIHRYINHFELYYNNKEFIQLSERVNY